MQSAHSDLEIATRVVARHEAADGVVTIELTSVDGTELPQWSPGAHIDLDLGTDLVRQYSLCGDPANRSRWRIGVLREPNGRGGSSHVHERLVPGTGVTTRGPRNHFELRSSSHYIFIAGGIGITPILPMVREAQRQGATWELHYGGRSRSTMAFRTEVDSLSGGRVAIHPQDERGLLDLESILGSPREDTLIYSCGPELLLLAVEAAAVAWPAGSLQVERFSPKAGMPRTAVPFEVELSISGVTLTVGTDESILEAVTTAGVKAWSSCQEGTCGTCETVVLAGTPDHRDSVLSRDEQESNETMMICVSRASSPKLVLEL